MSVQKPEAIKAEQLANAASFALSSLHRKENVMRPENAPKRDTVLIVDDSETQRSAMRLKIKMTMNGFETEEAVSVDDAIDKISNTLTDRVALIITDLVMPNKTGLHLARVLREKGVDPRVDTNKTSKIPTIVFSGSASSPTQPTPEVQGAIDAGQLDGFVKKPITDRGIAFYKAIINSVVSVRKSQ